MWSEKKGYKNKSHAYGFFGGGGSIGIKKIASGEIKKKRVTSPKVQF